MPYLVLLTTVLAITVTTLFAVSASVQARNEARAVAKATGSSTSV